MFVPQEKGTFLGLTVSENLKLATRSSRNRYKEVFQKVHEYFPELVGKNKTRAVSMSGGE